MTISKARWMNRALATTAFAAMLGTLLVAPAQAEDELEVLLPPIPRELTTPGFGEERPDKDELIDGALRDIYDRWVEGEETPEVEGGRIRVEVLPASSFVALAAALEGVGAVDTVGLDPDSDFGGLAATTLPVDRLLEAEALTEVVQLRIPLLLSVPVPEDPTGIPGIALDENTNAEATSPEQKGKAGADLISRVRAAKWHKVGVKGSKVKVGIIDYFGTKEWKAALAKGDVKKPAGTFCRINGSNCNIWQQSSAHGVGVAETILDIAPNASIYLATVETMEDHRAAVNYFSSKGVRIISRSLAAELDGRGDGTGPAAAVLDYAVKKKITWFNSAGNQGVQKMSQNIYGFETRGGYWRGEWRDSDGDDYLDFAYNQSGQPVETLYGTCGYFQGTRWDDWKGNATDYDLEVWVYRYETWYGPQSFTSRQSSGAKPLEVGSISCQNGDILGFVIRGIDLGNGTSNDRIELMTNGMFFDFVQNPGSASQPFVDSKNAGGLAIGSIDVVTKKPEPNSARGPLIDGRIKPDLTAAANFKTVAYNGRFNGTSSATPAAAGAAALILSKNSKWSAKKLGSYMRTHATTDRGKKGRDTTYGSGELRMPLLNSKKPKVSGTAKVGKTLKVKAGKWTESVKRSYQWYRNGKKIKGATKKSYKLKSADAGKRITVVETAKKKNYKNAKAKSAKTKKIAKR